MTHVAQGLGRFNDLASSWNGVLVVPSYEKTALIPKIDSLREEFDPSRVSYQVDDKRALQRYQITKPFENDGIVTAVSSIMTLPSIIHHLGDRPSKITDSSIHRLTTGQFIQRHRDGDQVKPLLASILICLGDDFEGGDFEILDYKRRPILIPLSRHTVILFDESLEHGSSRVASGIRMTMAIGVDHLNSFRSSSPLGDLEFMMHM